MQADQNALLATDAQRAQHGGEPRHAIGQLPIGPAPAAVDEARLAGAAGVELRSRMSAAKLYWRGIALTGLAAEVMCFLSKRFAPLSRNIMQAHPKRCNAALRDRPRLHSTLIGSLDHFVGATEERWRQGKAERLGSLKIDDQIELVGACTGRSAGFAPRRMRSA